MQASELSPRTQAKHDAIHAAAQDLFMRHGFEGTSMDAIAAAAGVAKQTLYRYYQNKEDLFIATLRQLVLEQTAATTFARLRAAPIHTLPALEDALLSWAEAVLENVLRPSYLALLRVLIAELPRFPSLGELYFSAVPPEGAAIVTALLESAAAHGVIPETDLDTAVRLFAGPLLTYMLSHLLDPAHCQPPTTAQLTAIVRLFLHGVVDGMPKETP